MDTKVTAGRERGTASASMPMGSARGTPGETQLAPTAERAMNPRMFVLAMATFATGTGTFIVTGLLGDVAEDLWVSTGTAGHLMTVFAVAYALVSPVLVAATARVDRRQLLVAAIRSCSPWPTPRRPRRSPCCSPPG